MYPDVRNNVGSQSVPYIYDDRANNEHVADALEKVMLLGRKRRKELGLEAREWVMKECSIEKLRENWDRCLTQAIEKHASERGTIKRARLATI